MGKDWLPEAWQALEKAVEQKRKVAAKAAKKQEMDNSIEIYEPDDGLLSATRQT